MNTSLTSLLHLQGLPPLPRSLTTSYGGNSNSSSSLNQSHSKAYGSPGSNSQQNYKSGNMNRGSGPIPPPRPHSRRSSSSGSSFRASPEHVTNRGIMGGPETMRSSPRSLSSSPHSPHIDSGLGRSSADSFTEAPRAFVRVVKSPTGGTRLDTQLSQLRRDMQHLRQQDMTLLGQLLQINQGIQDLRSVLVPPPQPAPSSIPMFHSTPVGYSEYSHSSSGSPVNLYGNVPPHRNSRKLHHPSPTSRGTKMFARRSSGGDKLLSDSELNRLGLGSLGAVGGIGLREKDEDSDSLSSLEFGDV